MIKAVVFDWGGVLIDDPGPGLVRYCARKLGVEPGAARKAFGPFEERFQKGQIQEADLWQAVCRELTVDRPDTPSLWKEAVRAVFTTREPMLDLVRALQANEYKTGFLSNTEIPTMEYFKEQDYPAFDATVFSCACGVRKPEPRVYQIVLEQLETQGHETVFVDDRSDYVNGAKATGMKTVLYESVEQVKQELRQWGLKLDSKGQSA